ncbi:hypothetical protein LCGC14_0549310, partial [marine sediment metagenome]
IKVAKASLGGFSGKLLETEWRSMLKLFASDERFATESGKRLLAELKVAGPEVFTKIGSNQAISALARRGEDPFVIRMFNKVFKRPGTPVLPEGIASALKEASGGKLPKVTAATTKALGKAGVKGFGVGRKAAGLLGTTKFGALGIGVAAALEAGRVKDIMGRGGRAKKLALQGFQGLGPSSSVEYLRDIVGKQEAVARRKVTLQKFEPELFQEVARILSDTGPSQNTLTSTERRIGANEELGAAQRGRDPKDVQFLMDQLFTQMGQGAG